MEFFERAHVIKRIPQREQLVEDAKKKNLKKMLQGYKQNDTEAIKTFGNAKIEVDDSSSIWSFSELDSSNIIEENSTCSIERVDSVSSTSVSNVEDLSLTDSTETFNNSQDEGDFANNKSHQMLSSPKSKISSTSISECDKVIQSLSDDDDSMSCEQSIIESEFDHLSLQASSPSITSTDTEFDADGKLAKKINTTLKKLKCKMKIDKKKSIKLEKVKKHLDNWTIEDVPPQPQDAPDVIDQSNNNETSTIESDYSENEVVELTEQDKTVMRFLEKESATASFVKFEAPEPVKEKLSDVLSGYDFSTVKNLPSESKLNLMNNSFFVSDEQPEKVEFDVVSEASFHPSEGESVTENILINDDPVDNSNDISRDIIQNNVDDDLNDSMSVDFGKNPSEDSLTKTLDDSVQLYECRTGYIFVLKHPAEFYFHGKLKITVLGGLAEVFGHRMKPSEKPYEVYAPNYNYALQVRTLENQNEYYGLFNKLTESGLSVVETEHIVTTIDEFDVVLKLQKFSSRKIDFIEENFNVDLFSKPTKQIDNCFKKESQTLGCSLYLNKPWRAFEENVCWSQVVKYSNDKSSRGLVCGGKGTGKSTFLRYYINKCVSETPVLVLDLDPGQCEFTVAGNISATVVTGPLLGPNFTHLNKPDRMLNIAMINVMDNVDRYTTAVASLVASCSSDARYRNMPWIVNTMGLCNSLGLKIITFIILLVKPTFVVQMDSKNLKTRYEMFINSQAVKSLYYDKFSRNQMFRGLTCPLDYEFAFYLSQYSENSLEKVRNLSLAPRDERYLNYLAYFGQLLDTHKVQDLLAIVPYELPLREFCMGTNVKFSPVELCRVINGKIIALCQHSDNSEQLFTLRDKPLLCHGYGLIRGIDKERGVVYLLCPAVGERLADVNTLVYSDWVPELRVEARLPPATVVPYRTATLHQEKQLLLSPRRRFNPIQLLKMSRTS